MRMPRPAARTAFVASRHTVTGFALLGRRGFFILAVALLVLLARAARTWIVAADLRTIAAHRLGAGSIVALLRGASATLRGLLALAALSGLLGGFLGVLFLGLVRRAALDQLALLLL